MSLFEPGHAAHIHLHNRFVSWIQPAKKNVASIFLALESWNQQPLSIEQFAGLGLPLFVAQSECGAFEFKHALTQQASTALFVRLVRDSSLNSTRNTAS